MVWDADIKLDVQVSGLKESIGALVALESEVQMKIVRASLKIAAEPALHAARARAPRLTGNLLEGLRIKSKYDPKTGTIGASVVADKGWYKGKTFYAAMVEFGHFAGKRMSKKEIKKAKKDGTFKETREWVEPHPFMTPAYEQTKERILQVAAKEIGERVTKFVRKVNKDAYRSSDKAMDALARMAKKL